MALSCTISSSVFNYSIGEKRNKGEGGGKLSTPDRKLKLPPTASAAVYFTRTISQEGLFYNATFSGETWQIHFLLLTNYFCIIWTFSFPLIVLAFILILWIIIWFIALTLRTGVRGFKPRQCSCDTRPPNWSINCYKWAPVYYGTKNAFELRAKKMIALRSKLSKAMILQAGPSLRSTFEELHISFFVRNLQFSQISGIRHFFQRRPHKVDKLGQLAVASRNLFRNIVKPERKKTFLSSAAVNIHGWKEVEENKCCVEKKILENKFHNRDETSFGGRRGLYFSVIEFYSIPCSSYAYYYLIV